MSDVMPHFKFNYVDISGRRLLRIEAGGKVLHDVENLNEFYQVFGYRADPEMQADLLPDEFVWAEYINKPQADFSSCVQVHIIEYLNAHSEVFKSEYGHHFDKWIADHAHARAERGVCCVACRLSSAINK